MAEQHFLKDLDQHLAIFRKAGLHGRKVLEIGAGHGELTNAIIQEGAHCTAVELDEALTGQIDSSATLLIGDAQDLDLSFLDPSWACICNPPYSLLPWLLQTLETHGVQDALIMSSERKLSLLTEAGFAPCFELSGQAFNPPARGRHIVMIRGFDL